MIDVMAEMRRRVADGEDVESVRRDMIVRNYPTNEVEAAARAFDWISEKRDLEESGKMDQYEEALDAEANKLFQKRVLMVVFGSISIVAWFMIFGGVLGVLGAIFLIVIVAMVFSSVRAHGIH
jgi:hypothetical protein